MINHVESAVMGAGGLTLTALVPAPPDGTNWTQVLIAVVTVAAQILHLLNKRNEKKK